MLYAAIFFSESLDGFTMLILNQAGIWPSISGSTTCPGLTVPTAREWIRIRTLVCPCLLWRHQIQTRRPGSVALDTISINTQISKLHVDLNVLFLLIYSQRMSLVLDLEWHQQGLHSDYCTCFLPYLKLNDHNDCIIQYHMYVLFMQCLSMCKKLSTFTLYINCIYYIQLVMNSKCKAIWHRIKKRFECWHLL